MPKSRFLNVANMSFNDIPENKILMKIFMPKSRFLNVANMSFNDIPENKILMKIFEFTVSTEISFAAYQCFHNFRVLLQRNSEREPVKTVVP